MKSKLIQVMTNHDKPISITDLCKVLKCDTHDIRDILHKDTCFSQDPKFFMWSYNASKDDSQVAAVKKETESMGIKKGYYIKRIQTGLGNREIPWECITVILQNGIMVDDKTFTVPFSDITHICTGNPVLKKGEIIHQKNINEDVNAEKKETETMKDITITLDTDAYNHRRWGKPWIAAVDFTNDPQGDYTFGNFVGGYVGEDGVLTIKAKPGDYVAQGQKDKRKPNNSEHTFFIVLDDGTLHTLGDKADAYKHYLDAGKKENKAMENTITLTTIVDNLESGNKVETLKKAKADLEMFLKNAPKSENDKILKKALNKSVRTKADFIEILVAYFDCLSEGPDEEFDPVSDSDEEFKKAIEKPETETATINLPVEPKTVDNTPEKTQNNIDTIVAKNLENMPFIINSINALNSIDKTVLSNTAILTQNQDEIKAMKSTMVISINAMAREINELKNIITNQSETIKVLSNNVKNFDVIGPRVPVSLVNDDIAKKANEAKKTAEEKAQKRIDYINGLTGVDKDIFSWINGKKGMPVLTAEQICFALMDDFTGKETKAGIVRLVGIGLLEKVKQDQVHGFKIAKISDFKGVETKKVSNPLPVEKSPETAKETHVNEEEKPKGMKSKKTGKVSLRSIVTAAITKKECTIAELMEIASKKLEKTVLESSVRGIVGYHLPKAGINVIKTKTENGVTYKIENE